MIDFFVRGIQLGRRRQILIEALIRSSFAWLMVKSLPYSIWKRWLGVSVPIDTLPKDLLGPSRKDSDLFYDVSWAHNAIERKFGKVFTCLMLAFSTRAMLRSRRRPGILVLGVGRGEESVQNKLQAHAWVICGQIVISGGATIENHRAVAAYS